MRDHGATSTTVETPPAPTAAFTWRRPSRKPPLQHVALGGDELELLAGVLGELHHLEPKLERRRRQLGELRPERGPEPGRVGGRLAQRHRPAPRGAADEPRPERDLPRRPPRAFRPGEQAVEQHAEPSPERQLVADRFRELERLVDGRRRPSRLDPPRPARPSPGSRRAGRPAPIVRRRRRPAARQAVRSFEPRAPPAPRSARRSSGSSCSGSGARNERVRSSETISACPGRATFAAASAANRRSAAPARGVPGRPDRARAPA